VENNQRDSPVRVKREGGDFIKAAAVTAEWETLWSRTYYLRNTFRSS